jgi:acyl carrier protein
LEEQGYEQEDEQDELLEETNQYTVYARRVSEDEGDYEIAGKVRGGAVRYWSREQLEVRLREHLSGRLPEYMVPVAYVCIEKMPLTPNGKVDRKGLPAPETDAYAARGYEEPIGEIERAVAEIWEEALKVERVGRRDNFFELGGHSLLVMRVIARLRKLLNIEVTINEVFAHPELASLAERLINLQLEQLNPDKLEDLLKFMRASYAD